MEKYFLDVMKTKKNGLFLVQLPTGTGKSFSIREAFRKYASDIRNKRKIIYITSLKKNIAAEEFRGAFGGKRNYEKRVLYIRSNVDEVLEKLPGMDIPQKYRTAQYDALMRCIKTYNDAQGKKGLSGEYLEMVEADLIKAEGDFRRALGKALDKEFRGKPVKNKKLDLKRIKLDAIRTRKDLRWIGELYPAVFTDERQILLMSVSKFQRQNSPIIEPSYDFISSDMVKNAVIFIDEFDETKDTVLQGLVEQALASGEEYLSLFLRVANGISKESMSNMSAQMRRACEQAGKKEYEKLLEKVTYILEEHKAGLSFKLDKNSASSGHNFLFRDDVYHSFAMGGRHYMRAETDLEENLVRLFLESREEYYRNKDKFLKKAGKGSDNKEKPRLINVYGLLRDIDVFLEQFKTFVLKWAESYMEFENGNRSPSDVMMTIDNARNSIFETLQISKTGRQIIAGHVPVRRNKNKRDDQLPDLSFYNKGFQLFDLVDDDSHNENTYLRLYKLGDTPEKILAYLAQNAVVFGVSATAGLPSVIGNYDLDYLKDVLGEDFHITPLWLVEKYRDILSKKWKAYEDGRIRVSAEIVDNSLNEDEDLREELTKILKCIYSKKSSAVKACGIILDTVDESGKDDVKYEVGRYCNVAYAMRWFIPSRARSMLHLEMSYPAEKKWTMDKRAIEALYSIAKEDCGAKEDSASLFILHDDYDESKKQLLERLSAGEKIYVMSAYKTIGAGQNMQYSVSSTDGLVNISPDGENTDRRNNEKDYDAIYLGNVTNSTVNLYSDEPLTKADLINKMVQLEELLEHAEMGREDVYRLMGSTVDLYSTGGKRKGRPVYDGTYKTDSVRLAANRAVIQAIGRICRAHWKSPEIKIFLESELARKLVPSELDNHIMSPELLAIRNTIMPEESERSVKNELEKERRRIINKAENITFRALRIIRSKLSQAWTEESIAFWNDLRRLVMCLPTAEQEDWDKNILIRNMYITSGERLNEYQYIQAGDYSTVAVNFFLSKAEFEARNRELIKNGGYLMTMSEAAARLDTVLKYPGMKEYFEKEGFATSFRKCPYIMSAAVYNNVYKGALGEYCGKFILEKELGMKLKPITDPSKFEFFDFELSPGVYVDFKNWKFSYGVSREEVYEQIERKLQAIGGSKVYVINLVGSRDKEPVKTVSGRIVEISGLIDTDGNVLHKAMDLLFKESAL